MQVLPHSFFNQDTLAVTEGLIGKVLVREINGEVIRQKITEAEAYVGPYDLACHSARGRTARNEAMFAEAGTIYIYLIYGMYYMLNIVTEEKEFPAAVLIRGTDQVTGPGRLTRALSIDKSLNGKKQGLESGLWFEEGELIDPKRILRTPRIGVDYAGDFWSQQPYRFLLSSS